MNTLEDLLYSVSYRKLYGLNCLQSLIAEKSYFVYSQVKLETLVMN